MSTRVVLYSADGPDQTIRLEDASLGDLSERHLLWIDLASPDPEEMAAVAARIGCPAGQLLLAGDGDRPTLVNYGDRFRVQVQAVALSRSMEPLARSALTLVVGPNYVISVHASATDFLEQLRMREQGDSTIGALSAESFTASLLDWLLDTYFRALDVVVHDVDRIEILILGRRLPPQNLELLVAARRRVADLRRMLKAHRDVFYGMARPDFMATEHVDARAHFDALNKHYERAEDDLETARDLVVGSFELLATRAAQKTNDTMSTLTFVTVMMGVLALVAGLLGMNFALPVYQSGLRGFEVVVGSMMVFAIVATWVAWRRGWL